MASRHVSISDIKRTGAKDGRPRRGHRGMWSCTNCGDALTFALSGLWLMLAAWPMSQQNGITEDTHSIHFSLTSKDTRDNNLPIPWEPLPKCLPIPPLCPNRPRHHRRYFIHHKQPFGGYEHRWPVPEPGDPECEAWGETDGLEGGYGDEGDWGGD